MLQGFSCGEFRGEKSFKSHLTKLSNIWKVYGDGDGDSDNNNNKNHNNFDKHNKFGEKFIHAELGKNKHDNY